MSYMFGGCESLTSLDLYSFNTSNVKYMRGMFCSCYSLISIDVTGFDTTNVTDMNGMFFRCENLKSLDLSNFDTSKVTDMCALFAHCYSLTSLDLTNFDTSKTKNMSYMFYSSYYLKSLDLSSFDTSIVTDMEKMFTGCYNLETIYANDFKFEDMDNSKELFSGCVHIVGGSGTVYDEKNLNASYARIDTSDDKGYFTKKSESTLPGDTNGDGTISLSDALAVLQFLANEEKYPLTEQQQINADVFLRGDGITGMDALTLEMYDAGLYDTLPVSYLGDE